jgi:hypothetical protein
MRLPNPAYARSLRIVCTSTDQPCKQARTLPSGSVLLWRYSPPAEHLQTRANTKSADELHLERGGDNDLHGR